MNFISRFINNYRLNKKQEEVNRLYNKYGLTDEVLDKQIEINKERNALDIPDDNEKIYDKYTQ